MKSKITIIVSTFITAVSLLFVSGPMFVNQQVLAANVAGGSPGVSGNTGTVGHLYMGGLPGYPYFGGYPGYGGYPYITGYGGFPHYTGEDHRYYDGYGGYYYNHHHHHHHHHH